MGAMHTQAYAAQCRAADTQLPRPAGKPPNRTLTLLALALGTFAIGTGEFGSNGIIQLFAAAFGTTVPAATYAVTAYAFGVVIGSPLITVVAAKLNRRTLILGLMVLFVVGNLLSATASNLTAMIAFRFITGTVQGAYFGAGAVIATYVYGRGQGGKAFATVMGGLTVATIVGAPLGTFIGQHAGWRSMYVVVAGIGALALLALAVWVPRTRDLAGHDVRREVRALGNGSVWTMSAVAALGISSIFAVYTFIGPFVTDAADAPASLIPIALAVFGIGMATGNAVGGRIADRFESAGLVVGYSGTLVVLVIIGLSGSNTTVLLPCLFGVGALMMLAIPTIQVRLTSFAVDAPTLMGALNLAALNLANSIGAVGGSITISAGWGPLSTVLAGLVCTSAGLVLYVLAVPRSQPLLGSAPHAATASPEP